MQLTRRGPILEAQLCRKSGRPNINGPSVLAAPSWLPGRLANYYLYFSQHRGDSIWLAVADRMEGPWRVVPSPVLTLNATRYKDHIASPDVVVDQDRLEVRMYFHGGDGTDLKDQRECLAVSRDGALFTVVCHDLGSAYWRVFRHAELWYALVMPGDLLRSRDGIRNFEPAGSILPSTARHSAIVVSGGRLCVFYSELGTCPEAIAMRLVEFGDGASFHVGEAQVVLRPETDYEGGRLPARSAEPGEALEPARELRDPAAHLESGQLFLFYAAGGERCIALASGAFDPACSDPGAREGGAALLGTAWSWADPHPPVGDVASGRMHIPVQGASPASGKHPRQGTQFNDGAREGGLGR